MPLTIIKILILTIFSFYPIIATTTESTFHPTTLSINYINSDYFLTISQGKKIETIAFNKFSTECCSVEQNGDLAIIEGDGHTEIGASYEKFSIVITDKAHQITNYQSCNTSFPPRPRKFKITTNDCITWNLISGHYQITLKSKKTTKILSGKKVLTKYLQSNKNALIDISIESPLLELY